MPFFGYEIQTLTNIPQQQSICPRYPSGLARRYVAEIVQFDDSIPGTAVAQPTKLVELDKEKSEPIPIFVV